LMAGEEGPQGSGGGLLVLTRVGGEVGQIDHREAGPGRRVLQPTQEGPRHREGKVTDRGVRSCGTMRRGQALVPGPVAALEGEPVRTGPLVGEVTPGQGSG